MKEENLLIGKVMGVHGIRGEIKVYPLTDDPGRFYDLEQIYLQDSKGNNKTYHIELVRLHKGNVLLTLSGIADRTAAEKLIGRFVTTDRENAVGLEKDEYFIEDMIGMKVVDTENAPIGTVTGVIQTSGSTDNIEIKTPQKTVYIPARKVYFLQVDTENKTIVADIPEELMAL